MSTTSIPEVRVMVTSTNTQKQEGVQRAFVKNGGAQYMICGCAANSGIPHGQPWGMQHTFEGASARVHSVRGMYPGVNYVVGVESGVITLTMHTGVHAVDMVCVVIEDTATGLNAIAFSQGRPFPLARMQTVARERPSEIAAYVEAYYTAHKLPCDRLQQVEQATTMALAQLNLKQAK